MTTSSERRSPWWWVIAGAVVVVAAVAVTLVLTPGTDGSDDRSAAPKARAKSGYDLSSPQAAAESFARAADTGSGDTLLTLACVGRPACVQEHAAALSEAELADQQAFIREGVFELSVHLKDAEFAAAVNGPEPGTKNVPYRTPQMTGDAYLSLTFVQSGDDWLYYQPAE
jgi:hypothetical protein